jgi:uncharacterized membrane protein YhaH (DUF805 family)
VPLGSDLRRYRDELSGRLSPGERLFVIAWILVILLLPFTGLALALAGTGTTRTIGVVILAIGLLAYVTPITPIMRRRLKRRDESSR